MTPLPTPSSSVSTRFTWSTLPNSRGFELTRNGEILGTLRRPTIWSQNVFATTPAGDWIFRPCGFWRTQAEIVDSESRQTLARFKTKWSRSGTLTFADGQVFHLARKSAWRPRWIVTNEAGEPVLGLRTREKSVEIEKGLAISESRLALLILFTLCRVRQAQEDAASAAMVAVIAAS